VSFANYGFVGTFLVLGLFDKEMLFKYQMFCFVVGIFCTSYGLYLLIPKDKGGRYLA
jgi:predicted permease